MNKHYPQPTNDELISTDYQYIELSPFWFKVVQGILSSLKYPEKWQDYTAEIDRQVHELMLPKEMELWVMAWEFRAANGGFAAINNGTWSLGNGWIQSNFGTRRGARIHKTFAATNIRNVTIFYGADLGTADMEVWVKVFNPDENIVYYNAAEPENLRVVRNVSGVWDNVTEIEIAVLSYDLSGAEMIRELVITGVGENVLD